MNKNQFKIAFRNIKKDFTYASLNILGLTIGLICFVIIMIWVENELSYDRFHENADKLHRVAFRSQDGDYKGYYQTGKLAEYLKEEYPEIEQSTNFSVGPCKVTHEKKGFSGVGSYVDPAFFQMFSFPFLHGESTASLLQPNSLVITETLAYKMFGITNAIGKQVRLNEESNYTITGVIQEIPENSHMKFDMVMPYVDAQNWMKTWDSKWTQTYVLLKDNVTSAELDKKIAGVMDEFQPGWKNTLYLVPMVKSHLYALKGGGLIAYVILFAGMAIIVILLASTNYMSLNTSRSELRHKEIFIKKVSGSSRWHIASQFLSESIISTFIAMVLALLSTEVLIPSVNRLLHTNLNIEYNISTILYLLLIVLAISLLAGSYPAFFFSMKKINLLQKNKSTASKGYNFRKVLVVSQFVVTIFFLSSMFIVFRQIEYLKSKDLGFVSENVVNVQTIGELKQKSKKLKLELLKNPNIKSVTVSQNELTQWRNTGPISWDGKDPELMVEIGYNWVDYDFLKTLDLDMNSGRFFSKDYHSDMTNAIVLNKEAVAYLKLENPVGMEVETWFGQEATIIGIVEDFHSTSLHNEIQPFALLLTENAQNNNMFIKMDSHNKASTLQFIDKEIKKMVPDDSFEYQFLDDQIKKLYLTEVLTGKLAAIVTILSIIISSLGLLGLALSSVEKRIKEIGIRKVNGAKVSEILSMLNSYIIKWVAIAFVIATPIAYYAMNKWLENFAYKTTLSWWVFAPAGVMALGIALLTVSWQSWRAATRNPVEALRYE